MQPIEVTNLDSEVSASEAHDVKGGLRITFSKLVVTSYQISGTQ